MKIVDYVIIVLLLITVSPIVVLLCVKSGVIGYFKGRKYLDELNEQDIRWPDEDKNEQKKDN